MKISSSRFRIDTSRNGWSLVELLVAVSIITVLFSLGLVASRGIALKGKETRCIHNLRQLGVAFLAYTTETNRGIIKSQMGGGNIEVGWSRLIVNRGYIHGPKPWEIMQCPAAPLPDKAKEAMALYNPASPNLAKGDVWRWYTYGLNMCAITGVTKVAQGFESNGTTPATFYEVPLAQIASPANHVLFADSSSGPENHWPTQALERGNPRGLALRHGPKGHRYANAIFLDGHIERVDREYSQRLATPALNYGLNLPQAFVFDVED